MAMIEVDFNAQDVAGRLRLGAACAQRSLRVAKVDPGDWVWLTDGELRAGGKIEGDEEGLRARVAWETMEDIVPPSDDLRSPENVQAARVEFGKQLQSTPPNYREMLRRLPLLEDQLGPGEADAIRAQAAQAFGYPELALLAIEDALRANPSDPTWTHFRFQLLDELDHDRALAEAQAALAGPQVRTAVAGICTQILAIEARRLGGEAARQLYRRIIESTNSMRETDHSENGLPDFREYVHYYRGLAFRECGDEPEAVKELERAIAVNPRFAPAYEARALETYPSDQALRDFQDALRMGARSFWPGYYLAYHAVQDRKWSVVDRIAPGALRWAPPPEIRSNLLEWLGIACFMQGDRQKARALLEQAVALAPGSAHARSNLALLDRLPVSPSSDLDPWEVVRDSEGQAPVWVGAA